MILKRIYEQRLPIPHLPPYCSNYPASEVLRQPPLIHTTPSSELPRPVLIAELHSLPCLISSICRVAILCKFK